MSFTSIFSTLSWSKLKSRNSFEKLRTSRFQNCPWFWNLTKIWWRNWGKTGSNCPVWFWLCCTPLLKKIMKRIGPAILPWKTPTGILLLFVSCVCPLFHLAHWTFQSELSTDWSLSSPILLTDRAEVLQAYRIWSLIFVLTLYRLELFLLSSRLQARDHLPDLSVADSW